MIGVWLEIKIECYSCNVSKQSLLLVYISLLLLVPGTADPSGLCAVKNIVHAYMRIRLYPLTYRKPVLQIQIYPK